MVEKNTFWQNWIRPDGIDDLEALGFVGDLSPSDNACPNWSHRDIPLQVWVDLPLEFSEITWDPSIWYQYVVHTFSYNPEATPEILLNTNDIADVIDLIKNTPPEIYSVPWHRCVDHLRQELDENGKHIDIGQEFKLTTEVDCWDCDALQDSGINQNLGE